MSVHFVDSLAMFARRNAEEKFKLGDLKGAIISATMAKTLDPDVVGIDETLVAYKIHLAASKNRVNGATNWYKVLGICEGFEDIDSIKRQHNKLVEMVNPTKKASVATWGALRLIYKASSNLCDPNKRNVALLHRQALGSYLGHEDFRTKKRSCGIKVTKRACPRCRKWCKYEVPKVSSGQKHEENPKAKTVLLIRCSSCRCKFDPISGKTPNSRFSRGK